ncbi:MAG TPA: family 10 glycosylhydrolase [Ignavibacteriales bacterium]|nr:family 10 glycosylhydrolase [Ignavibacteriales bacterium]HOL82295.1 family 10 glycosylhydrolase [Ignavibacteriales bacterium]HOM66351.1 family 10 glycosylhydrolase [Ignavibacteriales bacterium]HPD68157.1 family 10 glycosylhydrolase [Ignavibacteriales bacterium]HPP34512.1 family 10 glycosylhydrolase [Ignavibacteriales bacterium]
MLKKIIFFCVILVSLSFTQSFKKHEVRGAWIATVANIDWPFSEIKGNSDSLIELHKKQLIEYFDLFEKIKVNTVYLQVRTTCDALYNSPYEPWSMYLTGKQGEKPVKNFDPLDFAIKVAHKRNIELHAWINPYRASLVNSDISKFDTNHVIKSKPEWIIKCEGTEYRFLNPGLPEVREYLTNIIVDIVKRYDVDGIHFDDYFYPYKEYGKFNDSSTFEKYKMGFDDIVEWRKNNVNILVYNLNNAIKKFKPWVKFGISPFGLAPNHSVNVQLGCDPAAWLSGKVVIDGKQIETEPYIDYILPQLYWTLETHYLKSLPNWTSSTFLNGRDLYIGHSMYLKDSSQVTKQIRLARENDTIKGNVYWSAKWVLKNHHNIVDSLLILNRYISLPPKMLWKANNPVEPVKKIKGQNFGDKNIIKWKKVFKKGELNTYKYYVVYRSENPKIDFDDPKNIIYVTTGDYFKDYDIEKGKTYYYAVTALNRIGKESVPSKVIMVK